MFSPIPTGLYIHMPWCVKKCPYCDFNSHESKDTLPEEAYIEALLDDFQQDLIQFGQRTISTVFIGGGTPSLFSGQSYAYLFSRLRALCPFADDVEITIEANPGTVEQGQFYAYREAGFNRLSLGIQSFNQQALKRIGRVHDEVEAKQAIRIAQTAGFTNINLDLMYGMPDQTPEAGLVDLQIAMSYDISHLSWYQFTLEPNTYFHKYPPRLPNDEALSSLEEKGLDLITQANFQRYEISAFQQHNRPCLHNLNYWTFGDYFGIGAGAHGKLTDPTSQRITRTQKARLPKSYLNTSAPYLVESKCLTQQDLLFEFMLNATRLEAPLPMPLFSKRTFLPQSLLQPLLHQAQQLDWIELNASYWKVTSKGRQFTNDLQMLFLD